MASQTQVARVVPPTTSHLIDPYSVHIGVAKNSKNNSSVNIANAGMRVWQTPVLDVVKGGTIMPPFQKEDGAGGAGANAGAAANGGAGGQGEDAASDRACSMTLICSLPEERLVAATGEPDPSDPSVRTRLGLEAMRQHIATLMFDTNKHIFGNPSKVTIDDVMSTLTPLVHASDTSSRYELKLAVPLKRVVTKEEQAQLGLEEVQCWLPSVQFFYPDQTPIPADELIKKGMLGPGAKLIPRIELKYICKVQRTVYIKMFVESAVVLPAPDKTVSQFDTSNPEVTALADLFKQQRRDAAQAASCVDSATLAIVGMTQAALDADIANAHDMIAQDGSCNDSEDDTGTTAHMQTMLQQSLHGAADDDDDDDDDDDAAFTITSPASRKRGASEVNDDERVHKKTKTW